MFDSFYEHPDLMFLDATVQLTRLTSSIDEYLGEDLIQLLIRTDPRMCSAASAIRFSSLLLLLPLPLVVPLFLSSPPPPKSFFFPFWKSFFVQMLV